jgi:glycosyltransferase involved in cell wall biosynthesis
MTQKTLICITTANQVEYTQKALQSIADARIAVPYELLVIDDASDDGTVELCQSLGVRVIPKTKAFGVTDSWNRAYREFVEGDYESLILANNDVLIPRGALEALVATLKTHILAAPMSTENGVGSQPLQAVGRYFHLPFDETNPDNVQLVQDYLNAHPLAQPVPELPFLNGFFLAMSRRIRAFELNDGNLFQGHNVNVRNEDELCARVLEPKGVSSQIKILH